MKIGLPFLLCLAMQILQASDSLYHRIYLLPGQGSDKRIFNKINFEGFDTIHLACLVPEKKETMQHYAARMMEQVDTSGDFSFIGVSLGGMIAVEMAQLCRPQHVIIISSAKNKYELPRKYRFMQKVPINKLFSGKLLRALGLVVQPIVEPDSMRERATFKSMMKNKNPFFLKRGIDMIIHWDRTETDPQIVHLHGTRDHTIPFRKVESVIKIKNGSHMMTLTRAGEVGLVIRTVLTTNKAK